MKEICMNRIKALVAVMLPASILVFSPPAAAQADAGWYVGAAYGTTSFDVDMTGLPSTITVDDGDSGLKIYGGFQFNKHLGAEVGYVDFGKVAFGGTALGLPVTGDTSLSAFTLAGVGTLPLNESFALFGKLGLWIWDASGTASVAGLSASADDSGTDLFLGAGGRYNFNKNWGLTLEVELYDSDDSVTMTSLGVRYKF
jgi:OOP family OmpA-OmpF porin